MTKLCIGALGMLATFGCAGSLGSDILLASARAAYPDCDQVSIGQRAEGIQQWLLVCGEPRLFGLRAESDIKEERRRRKISEDENFLEILQDESPPLQWSAAGRVDDAAVAATSAVAWLRPLRVELRLIGIGGVDGTSYFSVESPRHASCAENPELWIDGQLHRLGSARTESVIESRRRFVRRLDLPTMRLLATKVVEVSYCGARHALEAEATKVIRAWASKRSAQPGAGPASPQP